MHTELTNSHLEQKEVLRSPKHTVRQSVSDHLLRYEELMKTTFSRDEVEEFYNNFEPLVYPQLP